MPGKTPTVHKSIILALVILPLIAVIAAMVLLWNQYVFWSDIALLAVFYVLSALGVTIGYHRMLTHQGFEAPGWVRGMFLILGVMAFEGQPLSWTATHIKHHAHSDEDDDPHSPLHGFWHAHMGWIFEMENFADPKEYCPQLLEDPVVTFVDRYSALWMVLSLVLAYAIGGWTGLVWAGGVRIFLNTHITWSVNSVCHTFGARPFETTDESRNEWVVGLLAMGEGWHNNHHAFPRNAFHGMRWWQFDLSGIVIALLEKLGLVWNVQRVSPEVEQAQRERALKAKESTSLLRDQLWASMTEVQTQLSESFWQAVHASVSPAQADHLLAMRHHAETRLQEIRETLSSAANLKKQRLQVYLAETQAILSNLKETAQREWKRVEA